MGGRFGKYGDVKRRVRLRQGRQASRFLDRQIDIERRLKLTRRRLSKQQTVSRMSRTGGSDS